MRYQINDPVTRIDFQFDEHKKFVAQMLVQPAGGKMEYFITGGIDGEAFQIHESGEDSIGLRYKDPVSNLILVPHVVMMILVIILVSGRD